MSCVGPPRVVPTGPGPTLRLHPPGRPPCSVSRHRPTHRPTWPSWPGRTPARCDPMVGALPRPDRPRGNPTTGPAADPRSSGRRARVRFQPPNSRSSRGVFTACDSTRLSPRPGPDADGSRSWRFSLPKQPGHHRRHVRGLSEARDFAETAQVYLHSLAPMSRGAVTRPSAFGDASAQGIRSPLSRGEPRQRLWRSRPERRRPARSRAGRIKTGRNHARSSGRSPRRRDLYAGHSIPPGTTPRGTRPSSRHTANTVRVGPPDHTPALLRPGSPRARAEQPGLRGPSRAVDRPLRAR